MTTAEKWAELVEAYGEVEADRLVVCEFGSVDCLYDHARSIDLVPPEPE